MVVATYFRDRGTFFFQHVTSDLWECGVCVLCFHTSPQGGCRGSWRWPRSRGSRSSHQNGAAAGNHRPGRGQDGKEDAGPQPVNFNRNRTARSLGSGDGVNSCLAHLSHGEDKVHGRMLWVDAFQLHPLFKAVLHCWHSLGLSVR